MNRLNNLPRGFGAFPVIEVLDLTYNNLNERGLPGNFFCLETLRCEVTEKDLSSNIYQILSKMIYKMLSS